MKKTTLNRFINTEENKFNHFKYYEIDNKTIIFNYFGMFIFEKDKKIKDFSKDEDVKNIEVAKKIYNYVKNQESKIKESLNINCFIVKDTFKKGQKERDLFCKVKGKPFSLEGLAYILDFLGDSVEMYSIENDNRIDIFAKTETEMAFVLGGRTSVIEEQKIELLDII